MGLSTGQCPFPKWVSMMFAGSFEGLSPPCPRALITFTNVHAHRYLLSPFALPMALRPHGPDLGWVAH